MTWNFQLPTRTMVLPCFSGKIFIFLPSFKMRLCLQYLCAWHVWVHPTRPTRQKRGSLGSVDVEWMEFWELWTYGPYGSMDVFCIHGASRCRYHFKKTWTCHHFIPFPRQSCENFGWEMLGKGYHIHKSRFPFAGQELLILKNRWFSARIVMVLIFTQRTHATLMKFESTQMHCMSSIFFYLGIANQTVASHNFQKNKLPKALNCRQFHPSPEDLLRGGKARRAEYWENFTFAESLALEVDVYIDFGDLGASIKPWNR